MARLRTVTPGTRLSLSSRPNPRRIRPRPDLGRVSTVDRMFLNGRRIGSTGRSRPFRQGDARTAFYLIPREVVRLGKLNELLGSRIQRFGIRRPHRPSTELDVYQALLQRQVLRDVGAYSVATLLLTLAVMHLLLFASSVTSSSTSPSRARRRARRVPAHLHDVGPGLILGYSPPTGSRCQHDAALPSSPQPLRLAIRPSLSPFWHRDGARPRAAFALLARHRDLQLCSTGASGCSCCRGPYVTDR